MWILYTSLIIIVAVIAGILIYKYYIVKKNSEYRKLEKRGQNISMEDTSGLGVN